MQKTKLHWWDFLPNSRGQFNIINQSRAKEQESSGKILEYTFTKEDTQMAKMHIKVMSNIISH